MPKRIIVCSDGTGNTTIKGRGTNVFKLYEAVDLNGHRFDPDLVPQIALYDDGVGTENVKPLKIFAGMTGYGLGRNVRQLYKELTRVYDPGDEIYAFGFSRGAFTVRTLVGLIATCGIIDPARLSRGGAGALDAAVKRAYRIYRRCYQTRLSLLVRGRIEGHGERFRAAYGRDGETRIRFVGVWDTVDAVGLPFHLSDVLNDTFYRFKFPGYRLSPLVDRACHALALDDERHSFHPLLWDESEETGGRIEQVWFGGAHSNVGGGYPKQGMSLVALDWMLSQAEAAGPHPGQGLRLHAAERDFYRAHANVDDKLYDPRAGLGIFYRWKLRNVAEICRVRGVAPKLHLSVLERIAHGTEDYAPGNLPPDARVVFTPPLLSEHIALLDERATHLQRVLARSHGDGRSLLSRVPGALRLGRASYYVYLASCIAVLLAAGGTTTPAGLMDPQGIVRGTGDLVSRLRHDLPGTLLQTARQIWADRSLAAWLVAGFGLAYALALVADTRMRSVFSQFWYEQQPKLRDALKRARDDVQQARSIQPR